jgi:hypothetical protein
MIVYLKHEEIDKEQWDTCIAASPRCKPYAYSWYLDIMSPGWEALVDDDYDSVFPVPSREKFGIKYIATPIFLQQLGAFSPDKGGENKIDEYLDYMPEFYWLVDLCVGQKISYKGYSVTEKTNYELDLSYPYDMLWERYDHACRRNIEKSQKGKVKISGDITPSELIEMFIRLKEDVAGKIKPRDFVRLKTLMEFCINTGKGSIEGVRDKNGKIIFGQFLIRIPGYIDLLFGVNTPESREKRLNYYFINEIIRESAGRKVILDFAGSSIPSIGTFMSSFGSVNKPYYRIYKNSLPVPVRWFK